MCMFAHEYVCLNVWKMLSLFGLYLFADLYVLQVGSIEVNHRFVLVTSSLFVPIIILNC